MPVSHPAKTFLGSALGSIEAKASPPGGRGTITASLTGCVTLPPGSNHQNSGSPEIGAEIPCPFCFIEPKNAAME